MRNLDLPRPDAWRQGSLFPFIEDCWNNSLATVGKKNVIASRLTAIDSIFEDAHRDLKPSGASQLVPSFLLMRSFTAFRASVLVCLCLPTDSYPLERTCLENAGYAHLIFSMPELSEVWLKRDDNRKSRHRFAHSAVRNSIAASDVKLAGIYDQLYERTIDFGAHPNEKSVTTNLDRASMNTGTIRFHMLPGDGITLDHALLTCAQVGICALRILEVVFREQFTERNLMERIQGASKPF